MAGFTIRDRRVFNLEELTSIEGVFVEDLAPPAPVTGEGSGTLLVIGEFEDGPFNAPTEIFGGDITRFFGGFGYEYAGVPHNNPSARRHLGELWNGNGFIYTKFVQAQRMLVCRVDTSVGSVSFSPLACITGGRGPFAMSVGQVLTFTSSVGGPTPSDAIAATAGSVTGAAVVTPSGYVGGEQISIAVDGAPPITVTFAAADQTGAQCAARINAALGFAAATAPGDILTIAGIVLGTDGDITVADVTAGALAALNITAGSNPGTGNVGNVNAVTTTELAAIINGTAALTAIAVSAQVLADGALRACDDTAGSGTLLIADDAVSTLVEFDPRGTTVVAGEHAEGTIPAGTRVRNAGAREWVTMRTLTIEAGTAASPNQGPHNVEVRPALDDGTELGEAAGGITTLVDVPDFATFTVTNPAALAAALTEPQMDNAYIAAFDATLDGTSPAEDANFSLSARNSPVVKQTGLDNALTASERGLQGAGLAGRKFYAAAPVGATQADAIADRLLYASDRVFYTWPGWQIRIPEIAERGVAGGLGFTETGIITLRASGALAKINAILPPEENPGQDTNGLIANWFAVEDTGAPLTMQDYISLKSNGICAPRVDKTAGSIFQSGVTSSTDASRRTQARRKMADFIQDSLQARLIVFIKKLATQVRRDAVTGDITSFLNVLLSPTDPERQRIAAFSVDDTTGNTPAQEALGVFVWLIKVRNLASLDAIELRAEIGESVVVSAS